MILDPQDRQCPTAPERPGRGLGGVALILLALSGLAFFHPFLWPLTGQFGGGVWARLFHSFFGVLLALSFLALAVCLRQLNVMMAPDWSWGARAWERAGADEDGVAGPGRCQGDQGLLFSALLVCIALLGASGLPLWRAYVDLPVAQLRAAAVVHAASAAVTIALIALHVYAAIWGKATLRALWYGTLTRVWYRQATSR